MVLSFVLVFYRWERLNTFPGMVVLIELDSKPWLTPGLGLNFRGAALCQYPILALCPVLARWEVGLWHVNSIIHVCESWVFHMIGTGWIWSQLIAFSSNFTSILLNSQNYVVEYFLNLPKIFLILIFQFFILFIVSF